MNLLESVSRVIIHHKSNVTDIARLNVSYIKNDLSYDIYLGLRQCYNKRSTEPVKCRMLQNKHSTSQVRPRTKFLAVQWSISMTQFHFRPENNKSILSYTSCYTFKWPFLDRRSSTKWSVTMSVTVCVSVSIHSKNCQIGRQIRRFQYPKRGLGPSEEGPRTSWGGAPPQKVLGPSWDINLPNLLANLAVFGMYEYNIFPLLFEDYTFKF